MRPILFLALCLCAGCSPKQGPQADASGPLFLAVDQTQGRYAYLNAQGDTLIPFGKYDMCFTDTFYQHAMVAKKGQGLVVIDRSEQVLYEVFVFDNGPDMPSEGLFRVLKNGLIGYADAQSFQMVIEPQYKCAFPFENGVAKVSRDCSSEAEGEHTAWKSEHWSYIDKKGNVVQL